MISMLFVKVFIGIGLVLLLTGMFGMIARAFGVRVEPDTNQDLLFYVVGGALIGILFL